MEANKYLDFDTFIAKRCKIAMADGCTEQTEMLAETLKTRRPLPEFYSEYAFYTYVWELVGGQSDAGRLYAAMDLWNEYRVYPRRSQIPDPSVLSLRQFIV